MRKTQIEKPADVLSEPNWNFVSYVPIETLALLAWRMGKETK